MNHQSFGVHYFQPTSTGLEFRDDIFADGDIHRCHVEGDKLGSKNGWYVLHGGNIPAGAFGCFKRGITETWGSRNIQTMADDEKAIYLQKIEASRHQRAKEEEHVRENCRKWCTDTFSRAKEATDNHPYLMRKGVHSYGVRQEHETLLIPLRDSSGVLQGMQFILPDGSKKFKNGTTKLENYFAIGKPQGNTLLICEGYATGASLHETTGHAVAVAFDAGNLLAVAKNLREKFPDIRLVVCADNDESGIGQKHANDAAAAVGGLVAIPEKCGCDFNDLHQQQGAESVKAIVEAPTVAEVATVTVANEILPIGAARCDLDLQPEDIQRMRSALAVIPSDTKCEKLSSSQIIGLGLRHTESGIKTHVGACLCDEWDKMTGGKSSEVFAICDPHYSHTEPVTTASIFALAKEHGWCGDLPWPKVEPLITHQEADPYPLDVLPGIIGAAVREVVDFVQCPIALGACSALAVISTVAQGLVDVRRADKLDGPVSLYILAIADSGERKTTVDGFFSKPVQQWCAEQTEAAKPDVNRFEAENQIWEAKKTGLLTAIKERAKAGKDTSQIETEVSSLEIEKPEPPKVPQLLFSDATPEALAFRLAHGWPVGGVLSSEAGIVFGGHAMGRESAMRNMATLNSLWGAEPFKIDRRTSPSYTVRNARLTMGLAVQPETVRAFLDASKGLARGIGWLARFFIAWPESTQGTRMYQDPPENWPHLAKFHRRLGALLDLPLPLDENGELAPAMLEFSPEAKAIWVSFHDDIEKELRPGRDMAEARDVASKAADNCARLAALFHVFENDLGGTIGPGHMQAAAVVTTWHLYEARRFMGELSVPIELSNAVKLNDWLVEYCRVNRVVQVSTRTVQQKGPACTRDKSRLDNALQELVEAGRVQIVKEARQRIMKINPLLLGDKHGLA